MVQSSNCSILRSFLRGLSCLLLLLPFGVAVAQERQDITLYSYHLMPPYLIDLEKKQGLYFDAANYFSEKSETYHFNVKYLPRKRIKRLLENNQLKGALLGVSPTWFKDKAETKYLWTDKVFADRDLMVSAASRPFEYQGPASLIGKTVGGVLGFYYYGVDELVAEGKAARVNTHAEEALLFMVMSKRVDAGIVSEATLGYLVKQNRWQGKFYVSKQPHDQYERRILLPKPFDQEYLELQALIQEMASDPEWQQKLKQYH